MGREQRWWGWGEDAHAAPATGHVWSWMAEQLGGLDAPREPVALEDVRLDPPRLPGRVRERFAAILRDDRAARVLHARGKAYVDLVRQRAGAGLDAPDAVLTPRDHEEVRAVLAACAADGVAVVPFGGGTSSSGGLEPRREGFGALVSLDLGALDAVEAIDERAQVAIVGAGIRLAELDALLAARGLTLGHVPDSFEYASIGGSVATRSMGDGAIEDLMVGLRLAAPAGELHLAPGPSGAGPDLRRIVAGSEGALGAITQVALRVRAAPALTRHEGWMFASFGAGAEALRRLAQEGVAPDVMRLADEAQTRMALAFAGVRGARGGALRGYLRARGMPAGAMAIVGWAGSEDAVRARREAAIELLRGGEGVGLGPLAGRAWVRGRFRQPYLRDELIARGVLVEAIEASATWSRLFTLARTVGAALRPHGAFVGCQLAEVRPVGASLSFTLLARAAPGAELEQSAAAREAAAAALAAVGGDEMGDAGRAAVRAVKAELDPAGVMNPGRLLTPA
jgi:alkyldihydroxyacetonephosphate synthase